MAKYIDEFGKEYESYKVYCNSPDLDSDLIYCYLARGERESQNEKEERWQREGKELLKKGYDISFN